MRFTKQKKHSLKRKQSRSTVSKRRSQSRKKGGYNPNRYYGSVGEETQAVQSVMRIAGQSSNNFNTLLDVLLRCREIYRNVNFVNATLMKLEEARVGYPMLTDKIDDVRNHILSVRQTFSV